MPYPAHRLHWILTRSDPLVYADWCAPCKQIAPIYEALSRSLSRQNVVTFVKINSDNLADISQEYSVTGLPTFLVFRDGQVIDKVQGADPQKLQSVVQKLATEVESLGEGSASGSGNGGAWKGAEIPRGYSDITDQIEVRNCELLNADDEAGPVKVLFENTKPSALDNKGKVATSKDWVQSGADDQLLLYIPFQSVVKLHTLQASCTSSDFASLCTNCTIRSRHYHPRMKTMLQQGQALSTYTSTVPRAWISAKRMTLNLRK